MLDTRDILKELSSLVQLDIDAIHAYDQAIKSIDYVPIRDQLTQFRADHERHVKELSEAVIKLGGQAPGFSRDFKGFLIQGFTAVRSVTGTEGALSAMRINEQLTNRQYGRALALDLPVDVKELVQKNLGDEQRHLRTIQQWIANRDWEQPGATV